MGSIIIKKKAMGVVAKIFRPNFVFLAKNNCQ
jgi:hypothetical protein